MTAGIGSEPECLRTQLGKEPRIHDDSPIVIHGPESFIKQPMGILREGEPVKAQVKR